MSHFIDNSNFSVDGVLADFPSTASSPISCLAHNNKRTRPGKDRALITTHNGASGIYVGSTNLAYQQAFEDGADVIDCSIQMSIDGVAFCLESADLMGHTTTVKTFMPQATLVPVIQKSNRIFSFDLSWSNIQSLKLELTSLLFASGMTRNLAVKNEGNFMTRNEFLNFAKNSTISGILINIRGIGEESMGL
ncbi:glycerophosphodiester phosphodiesterase GDPDL7-like isoform X1 [Zingiber officinale]|uniref:glycerophosphodiester phosphodiesterase GDPDL7-like isoform X1 n=1 Tax=Zingiber officinale TaxID=94328 RepID=UPI001C4D0DE5|nr:glycerophosphodiester phosphodiesterase GDPDL7-like isoform X1 [Zingiber officinale]XP_042409591.1 glycerophosphodiester phosphodiesterase GDPDL7-like isoform X1 [Zingiber officinale]